jgi:uncharacterized protein YecE (DUF72 family)
MALRVGTSGYQYRHWRGVLYPLRLPTRAWLARYAAFFDTVELNATFYRLPTPAAVDRWREGVPRGFVFAVKGSRYLTHLKRLRDTGPGLERFYEQVARLGERLAVTLWQLPPQLGPDRERLDRFLSSLPPGRHAVEFRDPAWYTAETCAVLERHGAAFCEHDRVDARPPRHTGGFRYVRFHGTTGRYHGHYGPAALRPWAEDLLAWNRSGKDAFVYFNNDIGGAAVRDALDLLSLVGEERPSLGASG